MKLSEAQRYLLALAAHSSTGNPWPLIGARQRAGGAKARMFSKMKANGWFDDENRITPAGRLALGEQGK